LYPWYRAKSFSITHLGQAHDALFSRDCRLLKEQLPFLLPWTIIL
jgi:hypothetical protein